MENKEGQQDEKLEPSRSDSTGSQNIVVDIEQGKAFDMDKDFKQVGKSTLYYIILQFCMAFALVFIMTMMLISSVFSRLDINSATIASDSEVVVNDILNRTGIWLSTITIISALASGWLVYRSACKKLQIEKAELHRKNPWKLSMILKYTVIAMGFSTVAGFLVIGIEMFINLFGIRLTTPDISLSMDMDVTTNLFTLLSVLVVAPIFEELICRGVILRALQRYNTRFAIIVSAIIFGMLHMNLIQGLPAFAMGLVLAYVSVKANSVIPCIIMHFLNNAFAIFAPLLINSFAFAEIGFLVIEILMMLFAVYYIVSHRTLFSQDEDLNVSAKGYYLRFFNCWPSVLLIAICTILTLLSFTML